MKFIKHISLITFFILGCCLAVAQTYELGSYSFSNGGTKVSSTSYNLMPTVGQPLSGEAISSNYKLSAGFLPTAIPRLAELTVEDLVASPSEVTPGGEVGISFSLINTGGVGAFLDIGAEVYLSSNNQFELTDIKLDSFGITSDLGAGDVFSFPIGPDPKAILIPDTTATFTYTLFVVLTTSELLKEIDDDNAFGVSITVTDDPDNDFPDIDFPGPVVGVFDTTENIEVSVTDASEIDQVIFHHRKISGTAYETVQLTSSGQTYSITPEASWADDIGMEGFFTASDVVGNSTSPTGATHYFWYKPIAQSGESIPFTSSFDGTSLTYEMFSVPYDLDDNSFLVLFEELGSYDKELWRIFHHNGVEYVELQDGLNNIEIGKGYWFNTISTDVTVNIENGTTVTVSEENPFEISIRQGWNQIGNPYPSPISWDAIEAANPDLNLNSLFFYENGSYIMKTLMNSWEGAFLFSDNAGTLSIPVSSIQTGGRVDKQESIIDASGWQLDLTVKLNDLTHSGAIGMHPDAKVGKDSFDEITVPRFIDYLELTTNHPEFIAPKFSYDFVPSREEYIWDFHLASSQSNGVATISWSQLELDGSAIMMLLDRTTNSIINMTEQNSYSFAWSEGRDFKIFYSENGHFDPGFTALGQGFPNPFSEKVLIPVFVEHPNENINVLVYDAAGKVVNELEEKFEFPGLAYIEWNGRDANGAALSKGVYYYRLSNIKVNSTVIRLIKFK